MSLDYRLQEIINNIFNSDLHIYKSILEIKTFGRGYTSKTIVDELRTFVEQITLYIYCIQNKKFVHEDYNEIKHILKNANNLKSCKPLCDLHKYLQVLASHYSIDEDAAERAMIRYYSYLYDIRQLLSQPQFNLKVLSNLEKFPLNTDHNLDEYYSKIAAEIDKHHEYEEPTSRLYVYSEKEFYVKNKKYFEIILLNANDFSSKFDRIVVFSNKYVLPNYAIKASFYDASICIFNKNIQIKIINTWEVSIRCCEIAKFLKLTGKSCSSSYSISSEYRSLMNFLTCNTCTLNDLVGLNDLEFERLKLQIIGQGKKSQIMDAISCSREIILNKKAWSNTLSYLIYKMNNVILRKVLTDKENHWLYISQKCYPFESMPFVTSLPAHNPSIQDLFESIDTGGRDYEIMVNNLLRKSSNDNTLYFQITDETESYKEAIEKYNSKLCNKHNGRRIEKYKNRYFLKESEEATKYIIEKLKKFEESGLQFYDATVESFFSRFPKLVDSEEKRSIVNSLFKCSKIGIINGSAGSGKTTFLSYLPKLFDDAEIMVLCVTNTALYNLRSKLGNSNKIRYCTIASIANTSETWNTDLLIIDECSTVNNLDFRKILEKIDCDCIVLAGDTYQIEAIEFGNWFSLAQNFVKKDFCHNLSLVHRSSNKNLKLLWEKVRNCDSKVPEIICKKAFSKQLGDDIFNKLSDDEVILCLNYSGLYGVNNINNICQQMNQNNAYYWNNLVYKPGDPILFNDNDRFDGYITNNQKGVIVKIEQTTDRIIFL